MRVKNHSSSLYSGLPNLFALPIAILAALLFVSLGGIASILAWLIGMIFHETGHALMYWLNSQIAIPSFGMTIPLLEFHLRIG